jgi:predicted transcriptional regulator
MNKLQEQMLTKIAINVYNAINGEEPESHEDTLVLLDTVVESPLDRAVVTSLQKQGMVLVKEDGKSSTVVLTPKGFNIFIDL